MHLFKRLIAATGAAGLLIGLTGSAIPAFATGFSATIGASCAMPGTAQTIAVHAGADEIVHVEVTMNNTVFSATGITDASGLYTDSVTLPVAVAVPDSIVRVWVLSFQAGTYAGASSFSTPLPGLLCASPSPKDFVIDIIDTSQYGGNLVRLTCASGVSGDAQFTPTIQVHAYSPFSTSFTLPVKVPLTCNGGSQALPTLPGGSVITLHESMVPPGAVAAADTSITVGTTAVTTTIYNAKAAADAITVTPNSGTAITVLEGVNTGSKLVGKFTDSGNAAPGVTCSELYVATIKWGDGSSSTGTVTCERDSSSDHVATGIFDVTGTHMYVDSASYNISVSVVDNSESTESSGAPVTTDSATVTDAGLFIDADNSNDGSYTSVEGKTLTVVVDVFDSNNAYPNETAAFDSGITSTIDWGDGSALQTVARTLPTLNCDCAGDFEIKASHVYDARSTNYQIKVTAKDDGGQLVTRTFGARISDGKLTADANKSLSGVATTALTSVVGSYADEAGAQAAVADFAATINWGDNTATSTGTLTKTASGAFSVSGTHTYASAGSKSITATVTDEEGSTVTLHATATVAAAPIVLPQTGGPASTPTLPWLTILVVGLIATGASAGFVVLRRRS